MNILGNIISDGVVDLDGTLDGNVRCATLTVRKHGQIKGEAVADHIFVYGKIHGLIRAKHVHLFASCHIEGIVMHESLTIEDGAFIDGKCKRTDKPMTDNEFDSPFGEESPGEVKVLENLRLIR
jgi:cytoskeletal protein CcmA (bactofilin family)